MAIISTSTLVTPGDTLRGLHRIKRHVACAPICTSGRKANDDSNNDIIMIAFKGACTSGCKANDDSNNDIIMIAFKGAIQDFLQCCAANCLQHICSSSQGTTVCKSCATQRAPITCNVSCAT